MYQERPTKQSKQFDRSLLLKGGLFFVGAIMMVQLFIIQVVKHEYYRGEALAEHVKKFEVPADRGKILASDGYNMVPIVLNETKFNVYADPQFIQNSEESAEQLQAVIGGDKNEIQELLNTDNRYVILAKKLTEEHAERVKELKIKGVGLAEVSVRSYPQGSVASHVLGFVNDDGQGQYGVESYLDSELNGTSGIRNEITDVNGTPLAINNDKTTGQDPVSGADIGLTIDIRLQQILEEKLKAGVERTSSERGSAILIDPKTGQIKAMANYPTYDPNNYQKVEDQSVFTNTAVTRAWEPGSVMKPLMMSTTFNSGALNRGSSYFDAGIKHVGGITITNAINYGARTTTMDDIIVNSLNTGAVHLLQSIGGGSINDTARNTWHDYLTNRYMFNKLTGIELGAEQPGYVKEPADDGSGIESQYANMAFGQGLTMTPIQLVAAYSALLNGGTYYKPTVVDTRTIDGEVVKNEPVVVKSDVISPSVSEDLKAIMEEQLKGNNAAAAKPGYRLGTKSGTAETPDGHGGYKTDLYNGAYIGYIEGAELEYVLLIRLDEPKTAGFASFQAGIVWRETSGEIINSIAITPR